MKWFRRFLALCSASYIFSAEMATSEGEHRELMHEICKASIKSTESLEELYHRLAAKKYVAWVAEYIKENQDVLIKHSVAQSLVSKVESSRTNSERIDEVFGNEASLYAQGAAESFLQDVCASADIRDAVDCALSFTLLTHVAKLCRTPQDTPLLPLHLLRDLKQITAENNEREYHMLSLCQQVKDFIKTSLNSAGDADLPNHVLQVQHIVNIVNKGADFNDSAWDYAVLKLLDEGIRRQALNITQHRDAQKLVEATLKPLEECARQVLFMVAQAEKWQLCAHNGLIFLSKDLCQSGESQIIPTDTISFSAKALGWGLSHDDQVTYHLNDFLKSDDHSYEHTALESVDDLMTFIAQCDEMIQQRQHALAALKSCISVFLEETNQNTPENVQEVLHNLICWRKAAQVLALHLEASKPPSTLLRRSRGPL